MPAANANEIVLVSKTSRRQKSVYWGSRAWEELFPKTSAKSAKKTKAPKPTFNYEWFKLMPLLFCASVVGGVIALVLSLRQAENSCVFKIPKLTTNSMPGRLTECVEVEVAQTRSALRRGLSGQSELPRQRGMLLDFGQSESQCIWMKDMKFSLDAVWMDELGKVVHLEKGMRPDSYPRRFCSKTPARYVLEVNASIVEAGDLHVGQQLHL